MKRERLGRLRSPQPMTRKARVMKLYVAERLVLVQLMQEVEGSLDDIRVGARLAGELGLSDAERKAIDLKRNPDGLRWNSDADTGVEIDLNDRQKEVISKTLRRLSDDGKLKLVHASVCDKFLGEA